MTVKPLLRFADARPVSPEKILIRVGIGGWSQCWIAQEETLCQPGTVPEDVQLLRESWPLELPKEAGERTVELEERLPFPAGLPKTDKLLYCRMEPEVQDVKVLADKVVFRGIGRLHFACQCQDGSIHSGDLELPFSQFAPLEGSHSPQARGWVTLAVTELETVPEEDGHLRVHTSLTAQYLVTDRELVETVADVWSPVREVKARQAPLALGSRLDSCQEILRGEHRTQPEEAVDMVLLPDFPRQRREGDALVLEQTVYVQQLLRDDRGGLRGSGQRLEARHTIKAHDAAAVTAIPLGVSARRAAEDGGMALHWEVPVQICCAGGRNIPQICGLVLGEKREPDPGRPSLILRRCGRSGLWELAKSSGSTVEAIRAANGLTDQPEPGTWLLIPVL